MATIGGVVTKFYDEYITKTPRFDADADANGDGDGDGDASITSGS